VAVILELAENANAYTSLGPDEERVEEDGFVIWFGSVDAPWSTVVQRLRLSADQLVEQVAHIRSLVRERGRRVCTWEIAGSATPSDLHERLLELGCVPDREPFAVGMVLREAPRWPESPGVTARRVETIDELQSAIRIAAAAFDMPDDELEQLLTRADDALAKQGERGATYLAWVDGKPAARGYAAYTDHGLVLFGGATLPEARGRGAYRALVRARWEDAVARGTPALVTHAGAMSRPILRRLGFEEVSEIRILLDRFDGGD
jgi:ribosomal protein S18 acetylase RimI-like enzyme